MYRLRARKPGGQKETERGPAAAGMPVPVNFKLKAGENFNKN